MNAAYRALRDPVSRVEYLLEQEGMALGAAGQAKPPADLFEEILELQEARMELPTAGPDEAPALRARLEGARTELEARRARTETELVAGFPAWDAADAADAAAPARPDAGHPRDPRVPAGRSSATWAPRSPSKQMEDRRTDDGPDDRRGSGGAAAGVGPA